MQKVCPAPARAGGIPPKYVDRVKKAKIGQFIGDLESSTQQSGYYNAALRYGKYAACRTVDGEKRVYIISKSEFDSLRKKRGAK
jgi:hypothetical protein